MNSLSSVECGPLVEGLVLELVEISQQEQATPTSNLWAEEQPSDQQVHVIVVHINLCNI